MTATCGHCRRRFEIAPGHHSTKEFCSQACRKNHGAQRLDDKYVEPNSRVEALFAAQNDYVVRWAGRVIDCIFRQALAGPPAKVRVLRPAYTAWLARANEDDRPPPHVYRMARSA
jgi:hypothetical protein